MGISSIYNNSTNLNFTINQTSGFQIQDLDVTSYTSRYTVGNNYALHTNSNLFYRNNFYGQLNANVLININGNHFVGTDHGILKSSTAKQFLEAQPSSGSTNIKAFWKDAVDDNLLYACGANGVILKSTNLGGMTTPYINITGEGRCVNSTVNLDYYVGSSINCDWTINGNNISNGCEDLSYYFDTIGTYNVSVTATNSSGGQATISETIYIVNPPEIDMPITIDDPIVCKEEPINIEIQNSKPNVRYILRKDETFNSTLYGISPEGNGETITLTSGIISEAGDYYLKAESTLANCSRNFSDRFYLEVEKTEAKFTPSLINAEINEPVTFSEASIDAQNVSWMFDSNPTPASSSLADPIVSFKELGATSVDLEVWSDNGCYDDITAPGPNIYETPANPASSWSILYNGEDLYNGQFPSGSFPGRYLPEVMDLTELDDGFLTYGYYNDLTFQSQVGVNLDFQGKSGGYLAKHNFDGVLRWLVYSPGTQSSRSFIYDAVEDSEGNIYICGFTSSPFYDNHSNEINVNDGLYIGNKGYIVKLDANGRYLSRIVINGYYPKRLAIDAHDNIISTGYSTSSSTNTVYINGVATTDKIATTNHNPSTGYSLVKLSSEGNLIWDSDIGISSANGSYLDKIGLDANNNIYICGSFESELNSYSASSATPVTLTGPSGDYGQKMFISKYNENGEVQWQVKSLVEGNSTHNTTKPYDMFTDAQGNCYVTGRNSAINVNLNHVFYNTDGSTTQKSAGQLYVAKVNTNGICEWVNGAAHSYYGFGYKVDKHNNRIYVAGRYSNNDGTNEEAYFTSTNEIGHSITLSPSDYIIAVYDLDGNLAKIIGNGTNEGDLFYSSRISGFFKDKNNDGFYMTQSLGYSIGLSGFQNFGHVVPTTNKTDAVLSKLTISDGITYFTNSGLDDADDDEDNVINDNDLCPNTPSGSFVDANGCILLASNNFNIEIISETCPDKNNGQINITAQTSYDYTATMNGMEYDFSTDKTIDNLSPGNYEICILVKNLTSPYCYNFEIKAGTTISGKASTTKNKTTIEITEGTAPYNIFVNGKEILKTMSSTFDVNTIHGDLIEVKTDISCEGIYSKTIQLYDIITLYPNPTDGIFELAIPLNLEEVVIELYNYNSQLISKNAYPVNYGKVQLDLTNKTAGVYLVKVVLVENPVTIKIIKE